MENKQDKKLNIVAFTNNTASEYWRFLGQAERINTQTEHEMFVTSYKNWNGDLVGANLAVVEMMTAPKAIDDMHAQGAKVIYEADDAAIDSYGKERENLQHMGPNWKHNAIKTIELCDALTVTSEKLKQNYARFTKKPIFVLPNYVDFNWYGKETSFSIPRNTNEIRLGWFGSKGHLEDMKMIAPIIEKLITKYPNLKFVYCGFGGMSSDRLLTEVGWGKDTFTNIPRDRREFYIGTGPDYWPTKHRTLDLDIGIAPLIDDYFNSNKTPIKWMEYTMAGVPVVASPLLYNEVITHGKTGFIAKTEEDWLTYLSMLIEDAKLRKSIAKAAKRKVEKKHDLDLHWTKWLDVYTEVASF